MLQFIIATLAAIASSMGLGGGTILILYFLLTGQPQKSAQGLNLLFVIPIALISTFFSLKNKFINKNALPLLIFGGLIGLCMGLFLLSYIENRLLKKLFAVFLILLGIRQIIFVIKKKSQ